MRCLRLQPCVDAEMNQSLAEPFTEAEVKRALFGMYPLKSPGPNGMPPLFFQKFWSIVGNDVCLAVLRILNDHVLLHKFNYTHIVLIHKCDSPETVAQLSPISLCNIIVKIASKCVANRLKPLLDSIISQSQSAFIPGRLITDNVLLAFELNNFLKISTRSLQAYVALKLDMSKAYDRVEWAFLRRVLLRLGFQHRFGGAANGDSEVIGVADTLGVMVEAVSTPVEGGLGFRCLREFNLALLAKQGWRILTRPEALISRVLKARYFQQCSFWDAMKGVRPSWTWSSILAARTLLGDGCVRAAPIEEIGEDRWLWRFHKNGRFTVKSTYQLAMDIRERDMPFTSNGNLIMSDAGGSFWSSLWKSRVPPKVKVFMWRLCMEALPTLDRLARRKQDIDVCCGACGGAAESSRHVLLECTVARQFWAMSQIPWRYIFNWPCSAIDWVTQVGKPVRGGEKDYFFMFYWTLWKLRCKRHMEGKHEDLMDA
ncbi:UNVERIFIED_CONTAM: hypothetical protein Slati_3383200 [Sesamum latifolium]|uniref:Reverse transcriptase domain-containing protein n=1 Tax=Sesamum latifolium TaxID=2727402 RepID=A0AAW2UED9_9LAMI